MIISRQPYLLATLIVLAGCSDSGAQAANADRGGADATAASDAMLPTDATERVLFEQLSCRHLAQAGVVISAMLPSHTVANTNDGGDGIRLFVPVKPMTFLGHQVVRLGGWQADPSGGAMAPFGRGPGTAPPNHISVTVMGTTEELRDKFTRLGVSEAEYLPDHTQEAWVDSRGEIIQPRRLVPGPQFEEVDNDLAMQPVNGAVTISCSANEMDFQRDIEARLGSK